MQFVRYGFDKKNATLDKNHQFSSEEWGFNVCFPENPVFPRENAWVIRETFDDCYENFGLRNFFKKKVKPKSKLSNWESKKKVNLKMDLEKVKTWRNSIESLLSPV